MADKAAAQKVEDEDMSIDELSAAIDAHMTDISKKKKPAKKTTEAEPKEEPEEKPDEKKLEPAKKTTSKGSEKEEVPLEKKEESEDEGTKIIVKRSYVSKAGEAKDTTVPVEEKGNIAQTAKVSLKPISDAKDDDEEDDAQTETKAVKTTMSDIKTKKTEMKPDEKKEAVIAVKTEKKEEPVEEKKPVAVEEDTEAKANKEPEEDTETEKEEPELETEEPKPEEPPKEQSKSQEQPKPHNQVDELAAQMPAKTGPRPDEEPPAQTLKTFDTKQYHIPIKPSHHHRKGGSFLVFIAVFAALLALVYILGELEIIDIAELISSY